MEKPKVIIDISGGIIQSIISDTDIDGFVLDFDDIDDDEEDLIVRVDEGVDGAMIPAYVSRLHMIEVSPERTRDLFNQIESQLEEKK